MGIEHWKLDYSQKGSLIRFLKALCGFCLHSTTDNISYDGSIQSQLAWNGSIRTSPRSFYMSIVGNFTGQMSVLKRIAGLFTRLSSTNHGIVAGVDVSEW